MLDVRARVAALDALAMAMAMASRTRIQTSMWAARKQSWPKFTLLRLIGIARMHV
jgi:hypothetical protein